MKKFKLIVLAVVMTAISFAGHAQKWGATPEDSAKCVLNYSLYFEFYKQKNYIDAYTPWSEMMKLCPARHKNNYIHGTTILKAKINKAKTAASRDSAIAELMNLYDMRIQYFGEAASVTARKAYDLETLKRDAGLKEYYPLYAEAVRLGGEELDADYVIKFFDATVKYVVKGFADSTLVVDNYDIASDLLENRLIKETDTAKQHKIRSHIASIEASFSPFASCEQLVSIYTKKFNADPENVVLLKKITNIMSKKDCTDESLFFLATEKLYSLEPSPSTAMKMGQMCVKKEKFGEAVKYLADASQSLEDARDKYKACLLLGIAYAGQGSYSAARSAFYEAAKADPTKGDPYIQIANIYARGSRSIDDGMHGRSAYWAAVDKLVRAKNVDPSPENVETVNKLIGSYASFYPKKDDAFMLNLMDGQGYTVGGWIGESTTVRTR